MSGWSVYETPADRAAVRSAADHERRVAAVRLVLAYQDEDLVRAAIAESRSRHAELGVTMAEALDSVVDDIAAGVTSW